MGWLLDRGPAALRGSGIDRYPVALAFVVEQHCTVALEGLRHAYSQVRYGLGGSLTPEDLAGVQQSMERVGALLTVDLREVRLVRHALANSSPRLPR